MSKDIEKSVTKLIKTDKHINSKYLGRIYDGWEVIHVARVGNCHSNYWFYLRKHMTSDIGRKYYMTITLSNVSMTAVDRGRRKIADILKGKSVQLFKYKNHVLQNTVMAKFED